MKNVSLSRRHRDSLSSLVTVLPDLEDRGSDKQRTPGVDTGCYIKSCKQHPALSSTSASALLPACLPGSPFLESTLPPQLNPKKSDLPKHLPQSHGYLYLFIFPSDCLCFIHLIFTMRLRFFFFFLPRLHFLTRERTIACSGEREQMSAAVACAYRRIHPHAFLVN